MMKLVLMRKGRTKFSLINGQLTAPQIRACNNASHSSSSRHILTATETTWIYLQQLLLLCDFNGDDLKVLLNGEECPPLEASGLHLLFADFVASTREGFFRLSRKGDWQESLELAENTDCQISAIVKPHCALWTVTQVRLQEKTVISVSNLCVLF